MHMRLSALISEGNKRMRESREGDISLRKGQAMMNVLKEWEPDLYIQVTGLACDPFYDDGELGKFFDWLLPPEYPSACGHFPAAKYKCKSCMDRTEKSL